MKTTRILATALVALFVSACSREQSTTAPQEPAPQQTVLANSAVHARGDLVPSRLVAIALPALRPEPTLSASMPGVPKKAFHVEPVAELSTRRDFGRVIVSDTAATGPISFPIDAPAGARVIVSSRSPHGSLATVHLVDAAGVRLDRARDEFDKPLVVTRVPGATPSPRAGQEGGGTPAATASPPTGPEAALADLVGKEPGFGSLSLPRRILSIDVPFKGGRVTLQIPAAALKDGVEIDVQQPNSPIILSGASKELNYGFGDVAEVEYTLASGATMVDGATMTGTIALPNGERIDGLTFASEGNGRYVAKVPLASADLKMIGVWHVYAKATGTVNGVEFERDIENGFGYAPAHARMLAVHSPEVVRGSDGLVDAIDVTVDVESVSDDRLGLGATLVYTAADGTERSVGVAQTSSDIKAGNATMTLHFESKDVALAQASGPFLVRDLTLISNTFATTQHRLGLGLNMTTPRVAMHEFRYPIAFSPAVDEMFQLGVFDRK